MKKEYEYTYEELCLLADSVGIGGDKDKSILYTNLYNHSLGGGTRDDVPRTNIVYSTDIDCIDTPPTHSYKIHSVEQVRVINFQLKHHNLPLLVLRGVNLYVWVLDTKGSLSPKQHIFLSRLLLCSNSVDFCRWVDMRQQELFLADCPVLQWYIQWYKKLSPCEQEGTLLRGGSISTFLGVRVSNDVDMSVVCSSTKESIDHPHVDCTWVRETNVSDIETVITSEWFNDPSHYFYWMGIKCMCLKDWLKSKVIRCRPKQYAELILLKKMCDEVGVELPPPPRWRKWYRGSHGVTYYTDNEYKWIESTFLSHGGRHPKFENYRITREPFEAGEFDSAVKRNIDRIRSCQGQN